MLEYIYDPMITPAVLNRNPDRLMSIAQYFGIDTLIKLCESHMITRINVDNAIAWLKIADDGARS